MNSSNVHMKSRLNGNADFDSSGVGGFNIRDGSVRERHAQFFELRKALIATFAYKWNAKKIVWAKRNRAKEEEI